MEFFDQIRIATDPTDPQFGEATQYFVDLKNENPSAFLSGFIDILECDDISQEYKNKIIPIMTSFSSKTNHFFLSVHRFKDIDMELIAHAESILLQYFRITNETTAKQASQVFAILRRIPRQGRPGTADKIGDLVEELSGGELAPNHLISVTRAMKTILKNSYSHFMENEYELMDVILNYFSTYTIPDLSKRHFLYIVSSIVGTYEFTQWPQENMIAVLNLCWEYSLLWPKAARTMWERLLRSHCEIINLVPDFTNLILDAVVDDNSLYPLMKVLCITLYTPITQDNQTNTQIDLMGERLEEGIILILKMISENSKEDNGIYQMEYSDNRCVPMMTTALIELASRSSQDALGILWEFVPEYIDSEDSQERYAAAVAFRAIMANMPYFPQGESQPESQNDPNVDIGPQITPLALEVRDNTGAIIDRLLEDDYPAIVVIGFMCMTIAVQNNAIPATDQAVEFLSSYTASDEVSVRDAALTCLTSVLSQLTPETKSTAFSALLQALEQIEDVEAASAVLRTLQTVARYLSNESAVEFLGPALELATEALQDTDSICRGPAVGLASELFSCAGKNAAEAASAVLEMIESLLGTEYDDDGLNFLNAFLTVFGDQEVEVLQLASDVALDRLESPPNEQILQTALRTAELVVPFVSDDDLLQRLLSIVLPFTEDSYVQNKCRSQLMALFVAIGAQSEAVVTANIELYVGLNDRLRMFHYYNKSIVPCLLHMIPSMDTASGSAYSISLWFQSALNYLRSARSEEEAHLFVVILEQFRAKCPERFENNMGYFCFNESAREHICKQLNQEDIALFNELVPPIPQQEVPKL